MSRFDGETFTIDHAGIKAKVEGLSGWRCDSCGEVAFDADSARRYATAGDELVLRERAHQSKDFQRIRRKLGLSQVAAARLTGGGHNAFSRYERGEATPMPAVNNLFRLLDKHPELLKELKGPRSGSVKATSAAKSSYSVSREKRHCRAKGGLRSHLPLPRNRAIMQSIFDVYPRQQLKKPKVRAARL